MGDPVAALYQVHNPLMTLYDVRARRGLLDLAPRGGEHRHKLLIQYLIGERARGGGGGTHLLIAVIV